MPFCPGAKPFFSGDKLFSLAGKSFFSAGKWFFPGDNSFSFADKSFFSAGKSFIAGEKWLVWRENRVVGQFESGGVSRETSSGLAGATSALGVAGLAMWPLS
jgi:hypothetical protein